MNRLTSEQLEFADRMTPKQWRVLAVLAAFRMSLTATERADPELYMLFRKGLVRAWTEQAGDEGPSVWHATEAGKQLMKRCKDSSLIPYGTGPF